MHTSKTGGTNIIYIIKLVFLEKSLEYMESYSSCGLYPSCSFVPEGCLGGVQNIRNNLEYYDLRTKENVQFIVGHMPLPTEDYFKKSVSCISIVRDPLDRLLSLGNYLYQRNFIEKEEIENFILSREVDNLQTRALAGEEHMKGECTEAVFQKAVENIQRTFAVVAPTEEVDILFALLANHYGVDDFAYARAQITGAKVISKDNKELCQKILERNSYDKKLHEFVIEYWKLWKEKNIEAISENKSSDNKYMVLSSSFYKEGQVEYMSFDEINGVEAAQGDELIGLVHY